jgi:hypothetical protein
MIISFVAIWATQLFLYGIPLFLTVTVVNIVKVFRKPKNK